MENVMVETAKHKAGWTGGLPLGNHLRTVEANSLWADSIKVVGHIQAHQNPSLSWSAGSAVEVVFYVIVVSRDARHLHGA
jgi:hypothetical protein